LAGVAAQLRIAAGQDEAGPSQMVGHQGHGDCRVSPVPEIRLLAIVGFQVTTDACAESAVETDRGVHPARITQGHLADPH
jgi:hypothetical protein